MISSCYPEGNFEGNQLPDGSIGLSPLCPHLVRDFHVITTCELPSEFPLTLSCAGIVHHLSGPNSCARARFLRSLFSIYKTRVSGSAGGACMNKNKLLHAIPPHVKIHLHYAVWFQFVVKRSTILAHMLDSLVRVSRRVG